MRQYDSHPDCRATRRALRQRVPETFTHCVVYLTPDAMRVICHDGFEPSPPRSLRQPEKDGQNTVDRQHGRVIQVADDWPHLATGRGLRLIHHDL